MIVPNDRKLTCWDYAGLALIGLLGFLAASALGCRGVAVLPAEDGTALVKMDGRWYLTDAERRVISEFPEGWEPTEYRVEQ